MVDKFDIIVMNPPYNQTIDLKFLSKSYGISDKILMVHPSTWLIDEKNKHKKFIEAKELVKDDLVSVRMFNGNGIFGISLFVPIVITYFDKNHSGKISLIDEINNKKVEYDNIKDINKYNTDEYKSLKKKFENFNDYISNHLKENKNYWVNLAQIRGNVMFRNKIGFPMNTKMIQDDFYTLLTKDKNIEKVKREQRERTQFSFDTEVEANNFLNYVKTKMVRFVFSIYKNNANCYCGEYNLIPWLDFTFEWTDEKLRVKFNITDKEWKFIDDVIPDYYE